MSDKPNNLKSQGGLGEVLAGATHVPSDVNLVRRAAKERWPIPEHKRAVIAERLVDIVETNADARNQTAAARVLASMDGLNQTDEHLEDKNARLDAGKPTERFDGAAIVIPEIGGPKR